MIYSSVGYDLVWITCIDTVFAVVAVVAGAGCWLAWLAWRWGTRGAKTDETQFFGNQTEKFMPFKIFKF